MTHNKQRRIIQVLSTMLIQGLILFLSAWTIEWLWAWIFFALGFVVLIINSFVIPKEVIEERGRKKDNVKKWDKILTALNILPSLLLYLCCGLDYRFGWTASLLAQGTLNSGQLPVVLQISGIILTYAGSMLFTWSMASNKFFSTFVRLQHDQKHTVAISGPYKYVRHPGYVGFIMMSLFTPIALGTLWGLLFSGITMILFIIRTSLEDNTLQKELPGYAEYASRVKYKLIPLIW